MKPATDRLATCAAEGPDAERRLADLLIARRVLAELVVPPDVIESAGLTVPTFMTAEDTIAEHLTERIAQAERDLQQARRAGAKLRAVRQGRT